MCQPEMGFTDEMVRAGRSRQVGSGLVGLGAGGVEGGRVGEEERVGSVV